MLKPILWILLILLVSLPVAAQDDTDPLAWIPADFAGYLRLSVNDSDTLTMINVANFAASFLQPGRITFEPVSGLESVLPLDTLDVEDFSFVRDIFPWLDGEIILAYRQFGPGLRVDTADMVMIFPTENVLQSASGLSGVIQGQDVLEKETYRDLTLYLADKTTIAFAHQAVLLGPTDLVKTLLDVQAGDGDRLIDNIDFSPIQAAGSNPAMLSGYAQGSEILRLLSFIIDGDESALPLLGNIYEALQTYQDAVGFEQVLLGGQVDGVGFSLQADTLRLNEVDVTVTLYTDDPANPEPFAEISTDVLNLVPQNAMIVHSGPQGDVAAMNALTLLPLINFSGQLLGAFPLANAPANPALDVPTADDIEQVVGGFLMTLTREANYDLEHDLLQHLNGSYSVALLPRPNDPLPTLNLPYDVLIVAEVDDEVATLNATNRLAEILLPLNEVETSTVNGMEFHRIQPDPIDGPLLQFGTVDNLLVVATGDALDAALDARRGDDRLVSRERWQAVSGDSVPQLYVDIPAYYSTFLPQFTGPQLQQIRQLGLQTEYIGDGLYQVHLKVTMPSQLS